MVYRENENTWYHKDGPTYVKMDHRVRSVVRELPENVVPLKLGPTIEAYRWGDSSVGAYYQKVYGARGMWLYMPKNGKDRVCSDETPLKAAKSGWPLRVRHF